MRTPGTKHTVESIMNDEWIKWQKFHEKILSTNICHLKSKSDL